MITKLKKVMGAGMLAGIAMAAGGPAAQAGYMVSLQPIQVCDDGSANCSAVNFDAAVTSKIWAQADLDVTYLPTIGFNDTDFLTIDTGAEAIDLALGSGHAQHADPLVLNVWFVTDISGGSQGLAVQGLNGIVIEGGSLGAPVIPDSEVLAHLMGHNFGLQHPDPAGSEPDNLMSVVTNDPAPEDIAPDGAGLELLTPAQIATVQASSFTVEKVDDGGPTALPAPGTLALFGFGILGLIIINASRLGLPLRRRRRAAERCG